MNNKYPIVAIPDSLLILRNSFPPKPKAPIKPSFPQKRTPIKPQMILKPSSNTTITIWVVIFLGSGILIYIHIPFLGMLFIIIGFIILFQGTSNRKSKWIRYNRAKEQYDKDFADYNYTITHADYLLKSDISLYENELLANYDKEYSKYLIDLETCNSEEKIRSYRINQIKNYLLSSKEPERIIEKYYQKGVSEDFFMQYLLKYFPGLITSNFAIVLESSYSKPYKPDFILKYQPFNLYIDIEIDEPYNGTNGDPIHFIGDSDSKRDDFFNQMKWIVIRFAEYQVVKYPDQCCILIKEIISNLISVLNLFEINNYLTKIETINKCTKEESYRLAYKGYRNSYLSSSLKEKYRLEKLDFDDSLLKRNDYLTKGLPF
jgi:hypothetical protein